MFYQAEHIGTPEHLVIEKNTNYSFPHHIHQCFEFITLLAGEMDVTVDANTYSLKKDDSILIFPNQIHSLSSAESKHALCIFSPDYVKLFSGKTQNKVPVNNRFRVSKELIALFEQLETNDSEMLRKGVLYLICDAFHRSAEYKHQEIDRRNLLFSIFAFVEKNFDGSCTLYDLASDIKYNYSYISRYFKEVVGISFNAYVTSYRLNHACYLIRNNTDSILKCALDSGFDSLRTFNRCFKNRFGLTPTEYKSLLSK